MSKVFEFIDWGEDFRYAEERRKVTERIQPIETEHGFTTPTFARPTEVMESTHDNIPTSPTQTLPLSA
jgi:hypothetical protein